MKKKIILINLMFICIFTFSIIAFAESLDNDVKVEANSDLTYYLSIDYDGVDELARVSNDSAKVNIQSDIIEVTDKLPQGLTYKGIVETDDGTIGAVTRNDGSACTGYVIDGINGIKYDNQNHTVSFKVKNLEAGCRLTVGIIVTTPNSVTGRMDFYNTFSAFEDSLFKVSNRVHVYMGEDNITAHKVKYEYIGDIPENAPVLPGDYDYASGTNVNVLADINLLGYEFSGWDTDDVNVSDGTFIMPDGDVTFEGSFTPKAKYVVKYEIKGEIPEGYVVPNEESYYELANVKLDLLKQGDVVNGYRFLGWDTNDVEILDDSFQMPNKNVLIKGAFERISYTVSYAFKGNVIPKNSDSLLPSSKKYYPGDSVTVLEIPDVEGYKFLGWYSSSQFKMPDNDVIIYGEWIKSNGLFEPKINEIIINKSEEYQLDDIVKFKITVTNTADYDIKNVMVRENNEMASFTEGDNYLLSSTHVVTIPTIKSKETIDIYAEYIVTKESPSIEKNEVEIVGALADGYQLNTDKEYKDSVEFKINNVDVPKTSNESREIIITCLLLVIAGLYISIFGYHKLQKKK